MSPHLPWLAPLSPMSLNLYLLAPPSLLFLLINPILLSPLHLSSFLSNSNLTKLCHTFIYATFTTSLPKAFWIIQIFSTEKCLHLTQNLMQIHCSTHSVTLNMMTTQYTRTLDGIYCPQWLLQWSRHFSHITFQSTLLGCLLILMLCKLLSLYWKLLDLFQTGFVY